jgi:hypothetical protein
MTLENVQQAILNLKLKNATCWSKNFYVQLTVFYLFNHRSTSIKIWVSESINSIVHINSNVYWLNIIICVQISSVIKYDKLGQKKNTHNVYEKHEKSQSLLLFLKYLNWVWVRENIWTLADDDDDDDLSFISLRKREKNAWLLSILINGCVGVRLCVCVCKKFVPTFSSICCVQIANLHLQKINYIQQNHFT